MTQLLDLARPFPLAMIKDNPSGYGSYVPHPIYKQRLLLYLGGYDFERVEILRGRVKDKDDLGDVVVGVVARLTVVIDGQRHVVEDCGDCEQPGNWPHDGARLKDAMSDALKRCCAHVGLGLHLYAKDPSEYVLYDRLKKLAEAPAVVDTPDLSEFDDGYDSSPPASESTVIDSPEEEAK